MKRRARLIAAAIVLSLSVAAPASADFYDVTAADLAGPPGSLIRVEGMPKIRLASAMAYRILYRLEGARRQDDRGLGPRGRARPDAAAPAAGRSSPGRIRRPASRENARPRCCPIRSRQSPASTRCSSATTWWWRPTIPGSAVPDASLHGRHQRGARGARFRCAPPARCAKPGPVRVSSSGVIRRADMPRCGPESSPPATLRTSGSSGSRPLPPRRNSASSSKTTSHTLAGKILSSLVLVSWSTVFHAPIEEVVAARDMPDVEEAGSRVHQPPRRRGRGPQGRQGDGQGLPDRQPDQGVSVEGTDRGKCPARRGRARPSYIARHRRQGRRSADHGQLRPQLVPRNPGLFRQSRNVDHDKIAKDSAGKALSWTATASPASRREQLRPMSASVAVRNCVMGPPPSSGRRLRRRRRGVVRRFAERLWRASPAGDRCGRHRDQASCKADPACFAMPDRGESVIACILDSRGFGVELPGVGCTSVPPAR